MSQYQQELHLIRTTLNRAGLAMKLYNIRRFVAKPEVTDPAMAAAFRWVRNLKILAYLDLRPHVKEPPKIYLHLSRAQ